MKPFLLLAALCGALVVQCGDRILTIHCDLETDVCWGISPQQSVAVGGSSTTWRLMGPYEEVALGGRIYKVVDVMPPQQPLEGKTPSWVAGMRCSVREGCNSTSEQGFDIAPHWICEEGYRLDGFRWSEGGTRVEPVRCVKTK